MPDIVIVRDGDGRAVSHDIPELQSELNPTRCVFGVPIRLIAGEEEDVGVVLEKIVNDLWACTGSAARIAGHARDDNRILIDRVATYGSFEGSRFTMPGAVPMGLAVIPVGDSKVSVPTWIVHGPLRDLDPLIASLDFESDVAGFVRHERVELHRKREKFGIQRVERERDGLVPRDFHRRRRILPLGLLVPPQTRCQRVQVWEIVAERFFQRDDCICGLS